jgi:hypothetical protein
MFERHAGKEVEETLLVVDRETKEAEAQKEVVAGEEAVANEKAAAAKAIKVWACTRQLLCFLARQMCNPCVICNVVCYIACHDNKGFAAQQQQAVLRGVWMRGVLIAPSVAARPPRARACCSDAVLTLRWCRTSARGSWRWPCPCCRLPWTRWTPSPRRT